MTIYDDEFDDKYVDMQSEYEAELIENALNEIQSEKVKDYYGTFGDSIEKRIKTLVKESENLLSQNFYGPSLIVSVTCIEVIIRFFLIEPLVKGAFFSDEWADLLTKKIVSNRSSDDKSILPGILTKWKLDINRYKLSNNQQLWPIFINTINKKRNNFLHKGETVFEVDAKLALECANKFLQIVHQISLVFGFTLSVTGEWCSIKNKSDSHYLHKYTPNDPFV